MFRIYSEKVRRRLEEEETVSGRRRLDDCKNCKKNNFRRCLEAVMGIDLEIDFRNVREL